MDINPYLTYSKTRKEVKQLLLATEGWYMYDGYLWDIKTKHLGAGVYRVYSVRHH